jgi:hypothetical protein
MELGYHEKRVSPDDSLLQRRSLPEAISEMHCSSSRVHRSHTETWLVANRGLNGDRLPFHGAQEEGKEVCR